MHSLNKQIIEKESSVIRRAVCDCPKSLSLSDAYKSIPGTYPLIQTRFDIDIVYSVRGKGDKHQHFIHVPSLLNQHT